MNWKVWLTAAAAAGGVVLLARRRVRRDPADATPWAEATDPVTRFGGA